MGTYLELDCLDCCQTLDFGKPITNGKQLTLRLFSENSKTWHEDESCWQAIQVFLFHHMNHRLVFRKDDTAEAQNFAGGSRQVQFDDLFSEWKSNTKS